jgi:tRNA nucleotidyltransferase (CCA-adding enzyme)
MTWYFNTQQQSNHPENIASDTPVKKIQTLCKRLKVPNEYRDLAVTTAKYGSCLLTDEPFTAQKLLQILIDTDAFRRAQRFEHFLIACEAISNSQTLQKKSDFPIADTLLGAFEACQQINTRELQDADLSGQQFAAALYELRLQAVAAAIEQA